MFISTRTKTVILQLKLSYMKYRIRFVLFAVLFTVAVNSFAQQIKWAKDGSSYYRAEAGEIVKYTLPQNSKTVVVAKAKLSGGTRMV